MLDRRDFLRASAVTGGIGLLKPIKVLGSRYQTSSDYFAVHPFIESHPEAVFIMQTDVDVKTNSEAKKNAGIEFGRSVFVPSDESGVPITNKINIKPNMLQGAADNSWPPNYLMGANTDPWFVEGVIESMKELGLSGNQFFLRDASAGTSMLNGSGYKAMAQRVGADILGSVSATAGSDFVNWVDIPNGIIHRKFPYHWPINTPDSFYLTIAKFKAHAMGLTLCCKNIQGSVTKNYQKFCSSFSGVSSDCSSGTLNPDYIDEVNENYARHLADGIPRWDKPGWSYNCGLGMEVWVTRTLDNLSASPMNLAVIEGTYGRDGSHAAGPHDYYPGFETDREDLAWDFMTNIIIFGKNPVHADIIGHWLGGHEPGNFGLFHIAKERGMTTYLNPRSIPLYKWENGEATPAVIDDFERTPLRSIYLQRNYNNQEEDYYHLVNENFDYSSVNVDEPIGPEVPDFFVLHQNRPNPFNPYTIIEYRLPGEEHVLIEIFNAKGQRVEVLVNKFQKKGIHMVTWNCCNYSSGNYFYRFRSGDFTETGKMLLLK